jgi:hypothetical protein
MLFRSRVSALILIALGVPFLASNLGWIPRVVPLLHQWWPLILILSEPCCLSVANRHARGNEKQTRMRSNHTLQAH